MRRWYIFKHVRRVLKRALTYDGAELPRGDPARLTQDVQIQWLTNPLAGVSGQTRLITKLVTDSGMFSVTTSQPARQPDSEITSTGHPRYPAAYSSTVTPTLTSPRSRCKPGPPRGRTRLTEVGVGKKGGGGRLFLAPTADNHSTRTQWTGVCVRKRVNWP